MPPLRRLLRIRSRRTGNAARYESLFASNVVLSRRPENERPDIGPALRPQDGRGASSDLPSLQDVADAVVRATGRQTAGPPQTSPAASVGAERTDTAGAQGTVPSGRRSAQKPISATGPLHPLLEGTIIDTVLTNRLDGSGARPVNCLVTNPVYSHSGQHVLIPAGARVLGETRPVQALGETRLAVSFHRLVMPDGSTQRLDQFLGLNQIGDAGLRDKVNQHYWSTFGAAAAVGLISRPGAMDRHGWRRGRHRRPDGDHRGRRRRRGVTGQPSGHEPIPQQASDDDYPRGTSREGLPHERTCSCPRIRVRQRLGSLE